MQTAQIVGLTIISICENQTTAECFINSLSDVKDSRKTGGTSVAVLAFLYAPHPIEADRRCHVQFHLGPISERVDDRGIFMKKYTKSWTLATSAMTFIATAYPVLAQQAPDQPSASAASDDIVVTARRREESLQSVPVSITALSAEPLHRNPFRI
jgi:hypothetical protein